jgi:hypothetical protein
MIMNFVVRLTCVGFLSVISASVNADFHLQFYITEKDKE